MRLKAGAYFDRAGRKVEVVGVSPDGWAYTTDLSWFYADTGQSALRVLGWFGCDRDLIERVR